MPSVTRLKYFDKKSGSSQPGVTGSVARRAEILLRANKDRLLADIY
jgi:hypothetical protein